MKNYPAVGSLVLRLSMAAVVAWFGASQIYNPAAWVNMIPEWAMAISPFSRAMVIYLNGAFEMVAALMLALGYYTRWVGLLLGVHLLVIAASFGASPTGVRDFGLALALGSLFFSGDDDYCLGKKEVSVQ